METPFDAWNAFFSSFSVGNRSICNLKLEFYGESLSDAEMAIKLDPGSVKGYFWKLISFFTTCSYYRRASAHYYIGNLKKACQDYEKCLVFKPKSQYCYFPSIGLLEKSRRNWMSAKRSTSEDNSSRLSEWKILLPSLIRCVLMTLVSRLLCFSWDSCWEELPGTSIGRSGWGCRDTRIHRCLDSFL